MITLSRLQAGASNALVTDVARVAFARRLIIAPALSGRLEAFNFSALWKEKHATHLKGTREWAFEAVRNWLKNPQASNIFWLTGGGGTGKSVLCTELLVQLQSSGQLAAWHFCRHDDPASSHPAALLRSMAAILCAQLPGFEKALQASSQKTNLELALVSRDPEIVFDAIISEPLKILPRPEKTPQVLIIDALDEIPKDGMCISSWHADLTINPFAFHNNLVRSEIAAATNLSETSSVPTEMDETIHLQQR